MNTLHLIDTTGPGGAETIFTELAAHACQSGHRSIAAIRGDGWVRERLAQLGVTTIIEDSKGSFRFGLVKTLIRLIRVHQIDLVHSHLLGSNVYASLAGLLTHTPVISTFHGAVDVSANERLITVKTGIIRHGSSIVAVSDDLRRELSTRLSIPSNQIDLIPNAIDCGKFRDASPLDVRSSLEIAADTPVLGALGNIRPAKAYPVALRAMAKLKSKGIEAVLLIAGDPKEPMMSELQRLREELDLGNQVHFLGFCAAPERFIASIDVFLLSSSSEGHPLALTQAMAAGLPIVATRCGVERIIDERMAWLSERDSPESLALAIQNVLASKEEAQRRGLAAQREAFDRYDFDVMFSRYDALYRRLAPTPKRSQSAVAQ